MTNTYAEALASASEYGSAPYHNTVDAEPFAIARDLDEDITDFMSCELNREEATQKYVNITIGEC